MCFCWYLEREEERDDVREKHQLSDPSSPQPPMYPDWGSNPQPFGIWWDDPTNWTPWPGQDVHIFQVTIIFLEMCLKEIMQNIKK